MNRTLVPRHQSVFAILVPVALAGLCTAELPGNSGGPHRTRVMTATFVTALKSYVYAFQTAMDQAGT